MKNKNDVLQHASQQAVRLSVAATILLGATISNAYAGTTQIGLGSIADQANPAGYTCSIDYGTWIHNAGVVEPGIAGCDEELGPIGTPTPLYPHLTDSADQQHTGTHRWWGSVSFYGDMPVGDTSRAGFITPDPITARITDRGFRMASIPGGLTVKNGINHIYEVPDPFSEVFDGLAIANSQYNQMDAMLHEYSDGSVTVEWQADDVSVMQATFVHGSPYVFIDVLQGDLVLKSKAPNGPEKDIYYQQDNKLGLWTDVAGNRATYLVVGDGATQFIDADSQATTVLNSNGQITIALLPVGDELPDTAMVDRFSQYALNQIDEVKIDYSVDSQTQNVTVTQHYLNDNQPVETMAGLPPLQWKNAIQPLNSQDKVRSARGITKFSPLTSFSYQLPFVGVLPSLPAVPDAYDSDKLSQLIQDFIADGPETWNDKSDTYWAGKNYGKVAELAALAHSHGLMEEHATLINWLKAELEDWFTASSNGEPDKTRYFSYDSRWNTLLGYDESFGAQQQLNDHHFHYGYFVRAAAEICRTDKSWCAADAWGGMVEMLIRDYAADRNDALFPYTRNFDPANGFSWASGHANFALGNNNESTSEAANAYGAIILYGLITDNQALTDRGIYLHASSAATYWEYWNNLDRYRGLGDDYDNFLPDYTKMTTSIIWGHGHVFSTWFSGAYAHILGIQGLPLNPLVMHIGQHADYLKDYVDLGLSESGNGKPSGLPEDNWRDVWWNIWAMTEAEAAIADFNTMNFNYDIEAGESMPHTYHWLYSFAQYGHLQSGNGAITADYPSALVFEKEGTLTYIVYNFDDTPRLVTFSDGTEISAAGNSFVVSNGSNDPDPCLTEPDTEAPGQPGAVTVSQVSKHQATLTWQASTDNCGVASYQVVLSSGTNTQTLNTQSNTLTLVDLNASTRYDVRITAIDAYGNESVERLAEFTTADVSINLPPSPPTNIVASDISSTGARLDWDASTDDVGISQYIVQVRNDNGLVATLETIDTTVTLSGLLQPDTAYSASVIAVDTEGLQTASDTDALFTTEPDASCDNVCLTESDNALLFTVKAGDTVDIHLTVNSGAQQNIRMTATDGEHTYLLGNLQTDDVIDYSFTVIESGVGYNIDWEQHTFGGVVIIDTQAPSQPGLPIASDITHDSALLSWPASTDNIAVDYYEVSVSGVSSTILAAINSTPVTGLTESSVYSASVVAVDTSGNRSTVSEQSSFTTPEKPVEPECTDTCFSELDNTTARVSIVGGGIADLHYRVNNGPQLNVRMTLADNRHQYDITNLVNGDTIEFFITVIDGTAYDTQWETHRFNP